jgi:hypothetical protein
MNLPEDAEIRYGSVQVTRGGRDIIWETHSATFCYIVIDKAIQPSPGKMPFNVLSRLQADCGAILAMIPVDHDYDFARHVLSRMYHEMTQRFTNNMRTTLGTERMQH